MLKEIILIRLCLIVLLIIYHAFAPFCGAWMPLSETPIDSYWWIGRLTYSFMLEAFVLISGYVFAYQVERKGDIVLAGKTLILKKAKRLLIPSIVFSIVYLLCFGPKENETWIGMARSIIEGRAHMWFLPMLFWCFVGIWLLTKIQLKVGWVITALILISIMSTIPLPLQLSSAMYYMLFFYLGYILRLHSHMLDRLSKPGIMLSVGAGYLMVFVVVMIINLSFNKQEPPVVNGALFSLWIKFSKLIYSLLGVWLCITVAYYVVNVKGVKINKRLINLSTYCFGIYLAQQFILQAIYYRSTLADKLPVALLPWVSIVITLLLSIVIVHFTLKTKVGRFLIA